MGDLVRSNQNDLVAILHGQGGNLAIPKPFEREIFLFGTSVAGTSYIEGIEELIGYFKTDDRLNFFREPDNQYDEWAIVIKTANGVKIGYVPRKDNIVFSRLMDAGKFLFGKIVSAEMRGKWAEIKIGIYLQD